MEKITFEQARKITSPNPFTLICTETPAGNTNIAPISWWTYLSFTPELIGFSMQKTSYSGEMVRRNKRVALAMPTDNLAKQAFSCGTTSGRDTNKVQKYGIEMMAIGDNSPLVPKDSCLIYECSLKEVVDVGDHYLYVCNVEHIHGDLTKKAILVVDEQKALLKSIEE